MTLEPRQMFMHKRRKVLQLKQRLKLEIKMEAVLGLGGLHSQTQLVCVQSIQSSTLQQL
jgi:hypothetical protein